MSEVAGALPAGLLYVPTRPRDATDTVRLEMRTLPDGRLAVMVYTSLTQLTKCCGPRQPWMAVDDRGLSEVQALTGYDLVMVDVSIPLEPVHVADDEVDDDLGEHIPRSFLHNPVGRAKRRKR